MSPHAARRPLRMRATPSWLIWKPFGAACGKALGDKRTPHGARRRRRLKTSVRSLKTSAAGSAAASHTRVAGVGAVAAVLTKPPPSSSYGSAILFTLGREFGRSSADERLQMVVVSICYCWSF
jgi:hypothetical protein